MGRAMPMWSGGVKSEAWEALEHKCGFLFRGSRLQKGILHVLERYPAQVALFVKNRYYAIAPGQIETKG